MLSPVRSAAWERDSNCRLGAVLAGEVCLLMPTKAGDSAPGSHEDHPPKPGGCDSTTPPSVRRWGAWRWHSKSEQFRRSQSERRFRSGGSCSALLPGRGVDAAVSGGAGWVLVVVPPRGCSGDMGRSVTVMPRAHRRGCSATSLPACRTNTVSRSAATSTRASAPGRTANLPPRQTVRGPCRCDRHGCQGRKLA